MSCDDLNDVLDYGTEEQIKSLTCPNCGKDLIINMSRKSGDISCNCDINCTNTDCGLVLREYRRLTPEFIYEQDITKIKIHTKII